MKTGSELASSLKKQRKKINESSEVKTRRKNGEIKIVNKPRRVTQENFISTGTIDTKQIYNVCAEKKKIVNV